MDPKDRQLYLFALRIVGDFGAAIAVPVVLFVIGGQWLDGRYGTGYRYTLIAFVLAALLSGRMIYRKAKKYGKEYEELSKSEARNPRSETNPNDKNPNFEI
ncbi:MAG: AtpZ/AtpI family protein [Patescibacteria group bacterium]